jgi:hypothetical protein
LGADHRVAGEGHLLAGVKMRTVKAAPTSSGGSTKVVFERSISRVICSISSSVRPSASGKTASGFPPKGVAVKMSACKKRYSPVASYCFGWAGARTLCA